MSVNTATLHEPALVREVEGASKWIERASTDAAVQQQRSSSAEQIEAALAAAWELPYLGAVAAHLR